VTFSGNAVGDFLEATCRPPFRGAPLPLCCWRHPWVRRLPPLAELPLDSGRLRRRLESDSGTLPKLGPRGALSPLGDTPAEEGLAALTPSAVVGPGTVTVAAVVEPGTVTVTVGGGLQ